MTELDDLPLEAPELQQALSAMVSEVRVGPDLRRRVERDLRSRRGRTGPPLRRVLAVAAAVAVLVGGGALVVSLDDGDEVVTVAEDPDQTSTTPPPTVAGIVIERPEGDGSATTSTSAPTEASTAVPVVSESPAPPAEATPDTTALVCRDSMDPFCGDFRWDPEPVVGQSTVQLRLPSESLHVGVPYDVVVELTDPTAPPTVNCGTLSIDPMPGDAWVGGFSCVVEPLPWCEARYGPWTPPEPNGGTIVERVPVTFDEPGTYTISIRTWAPPEHCYQPYGSDAATSITVEVLP